MNQCPPRCDACRVSVCPQENHQADEWGYVQGGHDIDDADFRVRRADIRPARPSLSLLRAAATFRWTLF